MGGGTGILKRTIRNTETMILDRFMMVDLFVKNFQLSSVAVYISDSEKKPLHDRNAMVPGNLSLRLNVCPYLP